MNNASFPTIIKKLLTLSVCERLEAEANEVHEVNEWKQFQVNHFNSIAMNYDKNKKQSYMKSLAGAIDDWVEDKSILYLGCGTGMILNFLQPKSVHGVDISPEMIRVARKNFPEHKFEVADAENFKPSRQYDAALLIECIDHMEHWEKAYANAERCSDVIIINTVAMRWYPILRVLEKLGLKMNEGKNKWVPPAKLEMFIGSHSCKKRSIYCGLSVIYRKEKWYHEI